MKGFLITIWNIVPILRSLDSRVNNLYNQVEKLKSEIECYQGTLESLESHSNSISNLQLIMCDVTNLLSLEAFPPRYKVGDKIELEDGKTDIVTSFNRKIIGGKTTDFQPYEDTYTTKNGNELIVKGNEAS